MNLFENFNIADINFQNKSKIGSGRYGTVCCVTNQKTGKKICIKRDAERKCVSSSELFQFY